MQAELRSRSFAEPNSDTPFDHLHDGEWVTLDLTGQRDMNEGDTVRRERSYECPVCGYELTELAAKR